MSRKKIYRARKTKPMSIVFFASNSDRNLKAVHLLSLAYPRLLSVDLLITDRFDIKAIDYANEHGIPVIARDFEQICGNSKLAKKSKYRSEKYYKCSINFHNTILDEITIIEQKRGYKFDLAVLSYYRWIHGKLLEYFDGRMINQHPADLSILGDDGKRKYIGINPAYLSILDGNKKTRTSTILVRNGHDTGEILCQGPWCTYTYEKISKENAALHELKQELISDVPSLVYTLYGISKGHFSIGRDCHTDGCKVIFHCDMPLPYSGYELELEKHLTLMSKVWVFPSSCHKIVGMGIDRIMGDAYPYPFSNKGKSLPEEAAIWNQCPVC